jgi:hypothetical protein
MSDRKKATSCSLKFKEQKILQGVGADVYVEYCKMLELGVYVEYCKVLEKMRMLNIEES